MIRCAANAALAYAMAGMILLALVAVFARAEHWRKAMREAKIGDMRTGTFALGTMIAAIIFWPVIARAVWRKQKGRRP